MKTKSQDAVVRLNIPFSPEEHRQIVEISHATRLSQIRIIKEFVSRGLGHTPSIYLPTEVEAQ